MDNSHSKRAVLHLFLFSHIKLITYAIWIVAWLGLPYLGFRLIPSLSEFLKNIGVNIEGSLPGGFAMSLLAALVAGLLGRTWIPNFQRWVGERTLPVNTRLKPKHLELWELYTEVTAKRFRGILPDELRDRGSSTSRKNKFLIPLRAGKCYGRPGV